MEIDLSDIAKEAAEHKRENLNTLVAVTIALLATFTGLCKVKDDNIVQAMQQAQADKIDHWSWYQSLHVREEVMADELAALELQKSLAESDKQPIIAKALTQMQEKLEHVTGHKNEVENQAKGDQEKYDTLNYTDDQFDLSDAMMALAISLLAITALVQKKWLYILSWVPASIGTIMGLSGFLGWHIHSDWLAGLLS